MSSKAHKFQDPAGVKRFWSQTAKGSSRNNLPVIGLDNLWSETPGSPEMVQRLFDNAVVMMKALAEKEKQLAKQGRKMN